MIGKTAVVAASLLLTASAAHANPLFATVTDVQWQQQAAEAQSLANSKAGSEAFGGNSDSSATTGNSTAGTSGAVSNTNKYGDSRALGVALGQSPTAAAGCLKGTKIAFGLLEWTDASAMCSNYEIAKIAAQAGQWELANQWACRADGMTQAQCEANK